MINLILGISLTLNVVFIVGIIIYFKVKSFGMKKVQEDLMKKFFYSGDEIEDNPFISEDNYRIDRL